MTATDSITELVARAVVDALTQMGITAEALRPAQSKLLNIEQAAAYLGMTVDALHKKHSLQKIKAVKLDNRLRFDREDLDKWVEESKERF